MRIINHHFLSSGIRKYNLAYQSIWGNMIDGSKACLNVLVITVIALSWTYDPMFTVSSLNIIIAHNIEGRCKNEYIEIKNLNLKVLTGILEGAI